MPDRSDSSSKLGSDYILPYSSILRPETSILHAAGDTDVRYAGFHCYLLAPMPNFSRQATGSTRKLQISIFWEVPSDIYEEYYIAMVSCEYSKFISTSCQCLP